MRFLPEYEELEEWVKNNQFDKIKSEYEAGIVSQLRRERIEVVEKINFLWSIYDVYSYLEWDWIFSPHSDVHFYVGEYPNWQCIYDDWKLFSGGKPPASKAGEPWLILKKPWRQEHQTVPADVSSDSKLKYFLFMKAIGYPIFFLEQPPASVIKSKKKFQHAYGLGDSYDIETRIADDGGIFENADVNSNCKIVDQEGCAYYLVIQEMEKREYDIIIKGQGHIEGYTSDIDRKLEMILRKDGWLYCYYYVDRDIEKIDYEVTELDKRWIDYHEWSEDKMDRIKTHIHNYMEDILVRHEKEINAPFEFDPEGKMPWIKQSVTKDVL